MQALLRLLALSATLQALSQGLAVQADTFDGFIAACMGNHDGTGECVNAETGGRYSCLIIPGQVIDCRSRNSRPFQCVWISGSQANYAEFRCDPQVDALLRNELSSRQLNQPFTDTTTNDLPALQSNEFTDSFRSKDSGLLNESLPDLFSPSPLGPSDYSAPINPEN
jgi:hypothetical protein